jgi:sulfur-oxidizing protein SoxB
MISRREFLVASVALAGMAGAGLGGGLARAAARQSLSEDDLLGMAPFGNVTLLHLTDIHSQMMQLYLSEP